MSQHQHGAAPIKTGTVKPTSEHDIMLLGGVAPPPPQLPEKPWPAENYIAMIWDDYDMSPWPRNERKWLREPPDPVNAPTNLQMVEYSYSIYFGTDFPASVGGFTGNHKKDYYASIEAHARAESGATGNALLRPGGFADLNWLKRCWEIHKDLHAAQIWAKHKAILRKKPLLKPTGPNPPLGQPR